MNANPEAASGPRPGHDCPRRFGRRGRERKSMSENDIAKLKRRLAEAEARVKELERYARLAEQNAQLKAQLASHHRGPRR